MLCFLSMLCFLFSNFFNLRRSSPPSNEFSIIVRTPVTANTPNMEGGDDRRRKGNMRSNGLGREVGTVVDDDGSGGTWGKNGDRSPQNMNFSTEIWEEEKHVNPFLNKVKFVPQFRSEVSRARWDEDMAMGEVIEKKGGMWGNTGIIRNHGKLYCWIEEIGYFAEKGALTLVDAEDRVLTLKDIYRKITDQKNGSCWESFRAYGRLKSLGYIVGRHGVPWTLKGGKKEDLNSTSMSQTSCIDESDSDGIDNSVLKQLKDMQINDMKMFDVYPPNSKFKKTSSGNPSFILCLTRGKPPSMEELEKMQNVCRGVPLRLCHVDNWLVSFFSIDSVELPVLP